MPITRTKRARHQAAENAGDRLLTLQNIQSASLELSAHPREMLTLYGTHAKEANLQRFSLHHGVQRIERVQGSSSPHHQPFFALAAPDATAGRDLAAGSHLVYSWNFLAQAELNLFGMVRAQIGIPPDAFAWQQSCELVVLNVSDDRSDIPLLQKSSRYMMGNERLCRPNQSKHGFFYKSKKRTA